MSLRRKLSLMLALLLLLTVVFAAGTILIFDRLGGSMVTLRMVSEDHQVLDDLERSVIDFLDAVNNWGLTGEARYRKQSRERMSHALKSFGDLTDEQRNRKEFVEVGEHFARVLEEARLIIGQPDPENDLRVSASLQRLASHGREVISRLDAMQKHAVSVAMNIAGSGEKIRNDMIIYHIALIVFSLFVSSFLIVRIRRTIGEPFSVLLKATERIGGGELSYRIGTDRTDEFGILADRLDQMAGGLETSDRRLKKKLAETELLLDVAKVAAATFDLLDALHYVADTIALKLQYDVCSIYLFSGGEGELLLVSSNVVGDLAETGSFSIGDEAVRQVISTRKPVVLAEIRDPAGQASGIAAHYRSVLILPILRDDRCLGVLLVGKMVPYRFPEDEISTLEILSHTVGAIIRNVELFQSTKKQLEKLTVLYGLSRSVTSVLNLDDLLSRIAEEIARVISARGAVIRLAEGGKLVIRSSFGVPAEALDEMDLEIGRGIAGWVAENGKPLLVDDAAKMPADMQIPSLKAKTVICVPLKARDEVIGTLGLYDRYDVHGNIVPFTEDDLNTVEGFASISAVAIEKSKIYENEVLLQQKSTEEKRRLNILFDSVQGGIITLDRDYVITSANRYVEEWVQKGEGELLGRSSIEEFHDRIGICPHCAAKATFETGEINTITQSRGVNYAELTSYPIRNDSGEISECVVFIMDITERVLYQEETVSLYREVIQTKDYLESIINNSADAIVTSDLEGIVTSWNDGAVKTFGFSDAEAIGRFLPFVPDFLLEEEKRNIAAIRQGEVLKGVETFRQKKDGTIIEVSLTLSPIKDAAGEIIGISGIARDISEKKVVERELIRKNQEVSRLFFISQAMRSTLDLNRLLRMVLTAVTMGDGMGFNRAILFLVDETRNVLKGVMGVGPASSEDAWRVWEDITSRSRTLEDIMRDIGEGPVPKDSFLERLTVGIEIPLSDDTDTILAEAVRTKRSYNVANVRDEHPSDAILIQQLGTEAYAVVPLVSRDRVIGLIWVDNYFNKKQITDEDMQFLTSFSNHIASAIESARLFEQVTMAEQQLENIFESMSDMVYFNSKDYEIKSINKAVSQRIGLPPDKIIGRKCYEVFHGTNEPLWKCPHRKTVSTKKAYIEELEDPHMGGTFLTSSSPIFNSAGEFIGSVHVVRDITEMKKLQDKLVVAQKMAALGEVAAKVAHEIRNPLVSVGGFAKRLEKKLEGRPKEYAHIIVNEVERLEGILKEILGFVKEFRLAREQIDLNTLVEDTVRLMSSDAEDKGIHLVREYGDAGSVYVDPNRIKEALVNMLTNAVQSIHGEGRILVKTYSRGDMAVLEITDTGKGIAESDRAFIFDPFFTTKTSGTGLGLAITHRIVQEHGGTIEVESGLDKGSTFRVHVPRKEGFE